MYRIAVQLLAAALLTVCAASLVLMANEFVTGEVGIS